MSTTNKRTKELWHKSLSDNVSSIVELHPLPWYCSSIEGCSSIYDANHKRFLEVQSDLIYGKSEDFLAYLLAEVVNKGEEEIKNILQLDDLIEKPSRLIENHNE